MIRTQFGDTTPFTVHSDDAPTVYITGNPGRTDPAARQLERESAHLSWLNPYTGQVQNDITMALADPVQEQTLHMVTADPARTPSFTLFGDPDWFFFASGTPATCATPDACASIPARSNSSFAWNHGDIQDEIATTWVGYVGPGVRNLGTSDVWTDHTDVRPTMLTLLGLHDDYIHDGRTVVEPLYAWAVPQSLRAHRETLLRLGATYKQLNAAFGIFAMDTLKVSTRALASGSAADDHVYTQLESKIESLTAARNALAGQMKAALSAVAFDGQALNEQQAKRLIEQGDNLLEQAHEMALGGK
jgi:hypothetical protein